MDVKSIEREYNEITGKIDRKEIRAAVLQLSDFVKSAHEFHLIEELERWETTYKYMLLYFSQGNPDPDRVKVYHDLLVGLYGISDKTVDCLLMKESPAYFYDRKRYLNYSTHVSLDQLTDAISRDIADISLSRQVSDTGRTEVQRKQRYALENDLSELFLQTWLSSHPDEGNIVAFQKLIKSDFVSVDCICLSVSALTLSLLNRFDRHKVLLLIDAAERIEEDIRQRALIGLLLVFFKYQHRISFYNDVRSRFLLFTEDRKVVNDIRNIVLSFIRSKETETISKRMTDEILPEMMKISPMLRKKMNLEEWQQESGLEDMNPDWQEIFEQTGLNDKLKELSQLQMEGSDIFMTTFSGLKSFPFFYNISNWFLPFSSEHSAFIQDGMPDMGKTGIFGSIVSSGVLCNSDKYSLCLSLMQMPHNQREMLATQFVDQGQELERLQSDEALLQHNKRGDTIAKQYIQDLYRFFKLHPHRTDFEDVFLYSMHFHRIDLLKEVLFEPESLRIIAEFFFRKGFYADSVAVFSELLVFEKENSELYQKVGYCHQMLENDAEALKAYLRAEMIFPESSWTIRRVAQCYRRLKRPEEALVFYLKYDKLKPDNLNITLNIGHCYLEKKNYNEALRFYFKADYLDNGSSRSWRPIAWCSFLAGKYEQAEKYYALILQQKPGPQDWMNMGHVKWSLHKISEALDSYLHCFNNKEWSWAIFKESFNEDLDELQIAGISNIDANMMLDQILYRLESE